MHTISMLFLEESTRTLHESFANGTSPIPLLFAWKCSEWKFSGKSCKILQINNKKKKLLGKLFESFLLSVGVFRVFGVALSALEEREGVYIEKLMHEIFFRYPFVWNRFALG